MKKVICSILLISWFGSTASSQDSRSTVLQFLENDQTVNQNNYVTATIKTSTRLFGDRNDLTSVIMIIPSKSKVTVLGYDSTYLQVAYEEDEGFIFRRHAVIDKPVESTSTTPQVQEAPRVEQPAQQQQVSRFSYLENKYGTNMAARLISGKIWKGMNSEMVKDSWGPAKKITREVSGNIIKEEWLYNYSWLYFENNTLVEWGPAVK